MISLHKVEKILKVAWIWAHLLQGVVNIWIFCFVFNGTTLMGIVHKLFVQHCRHCNQCFSFTTQANFPARNLNFHFRWRWWDQIQATFWNIFYFTYLRGQSVVGQACRDPKKSANQCSRIACWSRCYWKHCYQFRFRLRPFVAHRGHRLPVKRHWDPVHQGLCSIHPRYRSE